MTQSANENRFHLGFLRVAATERGFVGGLLVTDHRGRPLEFQCTTPVQPNRTQQILYGPTLEPFIFSELIGKTLFERTAVKPRILIVQQESLLELRRLAGIPVGCLMLAPPEQHPLPDQTLHAIGRHQAKVHEDFPQDSEFLAELSKKVPADADMIEPLDRVQDALKETLRAGAVA
jgi:hypothetical protein